MVRSGNTRAWQHGSFAHLEWSETADDELRLLLDAADDPTDPLTPKWDLVPLPMILGEGTLGEALVRVAENGARQAALLGDPGADPRRFDRDAVAARLWPRLSLLWYLRAHEADSDDGVQRPAKPVLKKTKRGPRLFPPATPTPWEVGVRLDAAWRRSYHEAETEVPVREGHGHARPRPHVRCAHWHGSWQGPRDGECRLSVRGLPPIPVNVRDVAALPATIHPVSPTEEATDA